MFSSNSNSKSATSVDFFTSDSKLVVHGKVVAEDNIPQQAFSLPIDATLLKGKPGDVQVSVLANSQSILDLGNRSKKVWNNGNHWIRAMRLAEDCHTCNVQVRLLELPHKPSTATANSCTTTKLVAHVIRPIKAGQELLLWFSEDILAMLQMAFLTPANIQGQKRYVCTRCSALYESPNPLKIHITLECGRYAITTMWNTLANALSEKHKYRNVKITDFSFKLFPEDLSLQTNSISLSALKLSLGDRMAPLPTGTSQNVFQEKPSISHRPFSEPSAEHFSAFKPFQKMYQNSSKLSQSLDYLPNATQDWIVSSRVSKQNVEYDDKAHLESLVSSLGKSHQGHVCLFCGKCYSRKYGLKIHIRTHTGYKPLKCKVCLRPFGDPSNLNKHIRLHAGDTPYKCDLCGKLLARRRDLERHLKSRHMSEIQPGRNVIEDIGTSETSDEDEEELSPETKILL